MCGFQKYDFGSVLKKIVVSGSVFSLFKNHGFQLFFNFYHLIFSV